MQGYSRSTMTPWRRDWARLGSMAKLSMVELPPMLQTRLSCAASLNIRRSCLAMIPFNTEISTMGTMKDRNAFTWWTKEGNVLRKRLWLWIPVFTPHDCSVLDTTLKACYKPNMEHISLTSHYYVTAVLKMTPISDVPLFIRPFYWALIWKLVCLNKSLQ